MSLPIHHLPVVQNWDCHATGACCRQGYIVSVTEEERARIEAQGWDRESDLGGRDSFARYGPPWARKWRLNQREDGTCVFLSEQGRCIIHERHGYETKPIPCRLFPFVLIPAGTEWRVGLRYACPSAAANKGRALPEHNPALAAFAEELARNAGLRPRPDGALTPPPRVESAPSLPWKGVLAIVETLSDLLKNRSDPLERRLRKCLAFAGEMRKANLRFVDEGGLRDLFKVMRGTVDQTTPPNLMTLPAPGWMGRILFRQSVAIFTRKDHGPKRGPDGIGTVARLRSALRFAWGSGPVPRMHTAVPATIFEDAAKPRGPIPLDAEEVLERYYQIKVGSLQFCGPASFGLPFWEGLEALILTFPIVLWLSRAMTQGTRQEAVIQSLTVVDDHFGFNRVLATARQRMSFQILARTGELAKLVGWYSR